LGEPPRTQWDLHFKVFGIPVRVHPFFWIVALLLGTRGDSIRLHEVLIWTAAMFVAILVHELGHALVMRAYGFAPWITLHGFGGLASYNPGQTYGSKGASSFGQILISAAGPGAGFLLAAGVVAALYLAGPGFGHVFLLGFLPVVWTPYVIGSPVFTQFINDLLFVCVLWGYFNLLPVYPLDGGQIARDVFLKLNPRDGIRQSLILSIVAGAAIAALALLQWGELYIGILFGLLAYSSYATLQAYQGRGTRW
jgi:Zn-dependent protease